MQYSLWIMCFRAHILIQQVLVGLMSTSQHHIGFSTWNSKYLITYPWDWLLVMCPILSLSFQNVFKCPTDFVWKRLNNRYCTIETNTCAFYQRLQFLWIKEYITYVKKYFTSYFQRLTCVCAGPFWLILLKLHYCDHLYN